MYGFKWFQKVFRLPEIRVQQYLAICLLISSFVVSAQTLPEKTTENAPMQVAVQAYQKGDFQAAFRVLENLAKQGNSEAQYNLAVLYQDGLGVAKSDDQAFYWYEKAAWQGLAEAQFMTGLLYSEGEGVKQDYEQAFYWYQRAAEQNHAEAQNNLAARYATGTGVVKNIDLAKYWYQRAAKQGNANAAYTLQQLEQIKTQ